MLSPGREAGMRRDVFSEEHELFSSQFRRFAASEIAPQIGAWNAAGRSDPAVWRRCGEAGFLGACTPEEYGGAAGDFLFDAVIMEELADIRAHGLMLSLHSDIVMPYLIHYG